MSKTLKLEISVADLGQNGVVVSEFATTDYVANELSKKATLNDEGKVDPSLLPDYTYIDGLVDKLDDVEQSYLDADAEILNAAKLYSDNKISENNSKKADLVEGKVPFEQLPFSMNFEQNVSTEFENVRQELRQNSESIVAQMDGLVGSANSYTDSKVLEEREFLNNTINEYKGEVNSQLNNFGKEVDDILKSGAYLPYDPDMEYVDGALTLKDGEIQQFVEGVWVPFKTNALNVVDVSGETQQQVNYNGGSKWYSRVEGYLENERVVLANGGIVKSTIDGNLNDPNVSMMGWEFTETKIVRSIDRLIGIPNPKTGQSAYMLSWHTSLNKGGGLFIYDESKASINDAGVVVFGWVRQGVTREVDPVIFGAKADFTDPVNAADANDDRLAIQRTIDYLASNGGGEVTFNSGKYWVNSYTESPLSAEPTYDIIMMQPNVSFSWSGGSQIIVGNFFHDKKFHLFSGYLVGNASLYNVHFKRPYITSILAENYKVTASHRRVVIEFRNCENVTVKDGVVRDIELSNCIGAGVSEGSRKGKNAHVSGMLFLNLTKSGNLANIDHTTVYLNAENSSVRNCSFVDMGTRGWEVSCPVELHASNTSFTDSYVYGYTRGGWFVGEAIDGTTKNQKIANNSGIVAHTVAQVWSVDDSTLQNCLLVDNDFELIQPSGGTPANFGNQALISTSGNAIGLRGVLSGLTVKGNNVRYTQAYNESFKRVFDFDNPAVFVNTTIKDNIFYGVNGGGVANLGTLDGFYLSENHFITTGVAPSPTTGFLSIKANSVGSLSTKNNKFTFRAGRVEAAIKLQYTNANRLDLGECEYTDTYSIPVVSDYYFPDGFDTLNESQLDNTWYNVPLSIPSIAANKSALVSITMPTPTKGIPFASKSYFTGNFGYPVLVHDGLSCGTNLSSINMYLTNVLPTEYAARSISVDCRIVGKT